jgi:hypothetical protein
MLQISARLFIHLALCFPVVTNLLAQSTGSQVVRARTVPIQRQLVPQPQPPTQTTFSKSTPSSYQINANSERAKPTAPFSRLMARIPSFVRAFRAQ